MSSPSALLHSWGGFVSLDENVSLASSLSWKLSRQRSKKYYVAFLRCFLLFASTKKALKNPTLVIDLKCGKLELERSERVIRIEPRTRSSAYCLYFQDEQQMENFNENLQIKADLYNFMIEQNKANEESESSADKQQRQESVDPLDRAALLDTKHSALSLLERHYETLDRQVCLLTEQTLQAAENVKALKKVKKSLTAELLQQKEQISKENEEVHSYELSLRQLQQARKLEKTALLNALTFSVEMLGQLFCSSPAVLQASKFAQKRAQLKLKHGLLGTPQSVATLDNPALLMLCNLELNEIYREIAAFRSAESALTDLQPAQRTLHQTLAKVLDSNAAVRVQVNAFGHKFDELTLEKLKRKESQFELKQAVATAVSGAGNGIQISIGTPNRK
jgi:hypothetical protein